MDLRVFVMPRVLPGAGTSVGRLVLATALLAAPSSVRADTPELPSGSEMATVQETFDVTLPELPPHVVSAFLAAEDPGFWGRTERDQASTITLQAVLLLLRHSGQDRSLASPDEMREMALHLAHDYTPEEVLEVYLNLSFFGRDATGLAKASEVYFGKSAQMLGHAEAAFLAALTARPAYFGAAENAEKALERRNWVLGRMFEMGTIDEAQLAEAFAARLP